MVGPGTRGELGRRDRGRQDGGVRGRGGADGQPGHVRLSGTDVGDDHFHADKTEHDRKPSLQENESINHVRENEVERAEAEDGADVRRVDDELILSDGEYCWD